ncbi:MAG: SAM-dependent DNA methyltransferase [Candidatus Omnitrophica bacterium]|nr:SAM-dependent DNA methyltransferase [Candidatus Omnitrophota bacterium]MBI3083621.1 SAM-dependent DNA methyltransferase [Candidatus Omnitrophota bacterium]
MNSEVKKIEFGDFQTPQSLADKILILLASWGIRPEAVIEPTCGLGSFVRASQRIFPSAVVFAFDINRSYITKVRSLSNGANPKLHAEVQDFFEKDWKSFFRMIRGDILIVGNPPWVTNASLGVLGGSNLPKKSNFQNHRGFAAKTGKANFDISEWMLIKILESLGRHRGCLAMLCKTATARKVLRHAWRNRFLVDRVSLHHIDAQEHFDVAVDACLLIVHTSAVGAASTAAVYPGLSFDNKVSTLGLQGEELVADVEAFLQLRALEGIPYYTWRSGVKHDAARVMEFRRDRKGLCNGAGEVTNIEDTYLYPLLKSSDLANGVLNPSRCVLLTQRQPNDDTGHIRQKAPSTWRYLNAYAEILDGRQSIIYQKRPRFSVFGVGDYTFAPWKVAISGFYKSLKFWVIGSYAEKPIVVDDTCYFIPCQTKHEAQFVCDLLNSNVCQRFLRSLVFLDAKRPVTIDVLNRIDLKRVAERLGVESEARELFVDARYYEKEQPLLVFEKRAGYQTKRFTSMQPTHARSTVGRRRC